MVVPEEGEEGGKGWYLRGGDRVGVGRGGNCRDGVVRVRWEEGVVPAGGKERRRGRGSCCQVDKRSCAFPF